jgi:hypothetical protein
MEPTLIVVLISFFLAAVFLAVFSPKANEADIKKQQKQQCDWQKQQRNRLIAVIDKTIDVDAKVWLVWRLLDSGLLIENDSRREEFQKFFDTAQKSVVYINRDWSLYIIKIIDKLTDDDDDTKAELIRYLLFGAGRKFSEEDSRRDEFRAFLTDYDKKKAQSSATATTEVTESKSE